MTSVISAERSFALLARYVGGVLAKSRLYGGSTELTTGDVC